MVEAAPAGGRSPDVIVVGGGLTGTSIAWRLAQAGHHVLLLERRGICAGASGRNAGNTGASSGMHTAPSTVRALHTITSANLQLLKSLHDELDRDFELRLPGGMDVLTTPEQMAHAKETVFTKHEAGSDVEFSTRDRPLDHALPLTADPGRNLFARPGAPLAICARHRHG